MNVGKFILFNLFIYVVEEFWCVLVENKLFVILCLISCQGYIEGIGQVIFIDMVGFICDLFKDFLWVFCFMLEEIGDVDVLLYVVDVVLLGVEQCLDVVNCILDDFGFCDMFIVVVLNKVDCVELEVLVCEQECIGGIFVSVLKNIGLIELKEVLGDVVVSVQCVEFVWQEEVWVVWVEWC